MINVSRTEVFPSFLGKRMQLGFVVSDLDVAMKYWTETLKVGPFVVFEKAAGDRRITYRGKITRMDMSIAFAYVGDVLIELVMQINDEPSPYKDFLESGREGLQHIAFWPPDFAAACADLEKSGFSEICSFYFADGTRNVAYYEPPAFIGTMVEIVPWTDARASYFGRMKSLADGWDGSRPIRRFGTREEFIASTEGLSPMQPATASRA